MTRKQNDVKETKSAEKSSVNLIRIDKIYESLRYNDYSAQNGLGEIVDNSVEAGAMCIDIKIKVEKVRKPGRRKVSDKVVEMAVIDDGSGMTRETLQRCLALGESVREKSNGRRGIGRFGVGMTLGSVSLARRVEVYSRTRSDAEFFYTFIDLDDISHGNQIEIPNPCEKKPPVEYADILKNSSGTIVILSECDRVDGHPDFTNYLGRTYRKFIERGLKIRLNDEPVYLHDPMYIAGPTVFDKQRLDAEGCMEPKATLLDECCIKREIPESNGETADVIIRVSLLPEEWRASRGSGGKAETKKRKIDMNEGISILRADREVFYGTIPYIIGKKGESKSEELDRWWGCEISFPPELDRDFQVRYIKRGAEPTADLRDQIREELQKIIPSTRKRIQEVWNKNDSEKSKRSGNFGQAEEAMAKADKNLPNSKKGKDLTEGEADAEAEKLAGAALGDDRNNKEKREQKKAEILKKPYSIEPVSYPRTILFETVHLINSIIIKLNVNHPFYKDIIQPLCGDLSDNGEDRERQNIKNAILLLLFSYAKAESMFDNHEDLFENLRNQWGTVLATALSEYDTGVKS